MSYAIYSVTFYMCLNLAFAAAQPMSLTSLSDLHHLQLAVLNYSTCD